MSQEIKTETISQFDQSNNKEKKTAGDTIEQLVNSFADAPEQLERLYHEAVADGQAASFRRAIRQGREAAPENRLFAAWYFRLDYVAVEVSTFVVKWAWVVPLALLNGLLFWILSDDAFMLEYASSAVHSRFSSEFAPAIVIAGAPLSATVTLIYLTLMGERRWRRTGAILAIVLFLAGYVLLTYPQTGTRTFQEQYLLLMVLHIPVISLAGVGAHLLYAHRDSASRFAFLMKSVEVFVMGGVLVGAGGIFLGITFSLFGVLGIDFNEDLIRLLSVGGLGTLPLVAVVLNYNPGVAPGEQSFQDGLSKLVALIMRLLLPLTVIVLVIYLVFIPFNFLEPFENRDVLFIFNVMLFGVIALLVGATPFTKADLSPRVMRRLRIGIVAVAALASLVSIYALAAIIYRLNVDRMTPNRLAVLGWNLLNTIGLVTLLVYQFRSESARWLHSLYRTYQIGSVAYISWAVLLILALPWLFDINQGAVETLPIEIQRLVYEVPEPILLKCGDLPHIYVLEAGEKRWIEDIETFNNQGYLWRDVNFVNCASLNLLPDGRPIPEDAGPPP